MSRIHKLSPMMVQRISKAGWKADGGGLYLRVRKEGAKTWIFRSIKNGKRTDILIGHSHTITLIMAREIAARMRLAVHEGRNPKAELISDDSPKTFLDAAKAIIERREKTWKSDKTAIKWRRGLMVHCKPIHDKSVKHITTGDVEAILRPVWLTMNHSARGYRGFIEQALDLATVLGWREGDNPARWKGNLEYLLPDFKPKVSNLAAMPFIEAPQFYQKLIAGNNVTRDCFAFTILTAARGHMARHAVWDEFDLPKAIWTIPAERMKKSDADHVVPLTASMIALLPKRRSDGLIWPYRGKGFSDAAFRRTMRTTMSEADYTPHGFRSTFKDWALEYTDYSDELSELALAHKVGSVVRRAYRRGSSLEKRRALMQDWSNYLHGL